MDLEIWKAKKQKTIERLKQELTLISNAISRHEHDLADSEHCYQRFLKRKKVKVKSNGQTQETKLDQNSSEEKSWVDNFI